MEEKQIQNINIEYTYPKFWHRVLANLVDIVIFVFLFFTLFLFSRYIVTHNDSYKALESRIDETRLDSGLYVSTDDGIKEIIQYIENYEDFSSKNKKIKAKSSIDIFISYMDVNGESGAKETISNDYLTYCKSFVANNVPYFIIYGDELIENAECPATDIDYYNNVYKPYITDKCVAYLTTYVPQYYKDIKTMSNLFFFVEFPIAYVFSAILTWFVPALFFKRGRKSLGKALYHIGLVNSSYLNPSLGKFTLRFLIFLFAELILSLFTFGIPFFVSFTLMGFSRKKQGFPDYMLGFVEIDNSKNKIYYDKVEIALEHDMKMKAPIDFDMEKPL